MSSAAAIPSYIQPYLLDTAEKVRWANTHVAGSWRLGDHCHHRPSDMLRLLPRGTIKRLHVDKRIIATDRNTGSRSAPLTIQTSKGSHKAVEVEIRGPSKFVYRPDKPLSCGARAWIETLAEVAYK